MVPKSGGAPEVVLANNNNGGNVGFGRAMDASAGAALVMMLGMDGEAADSVLAFLLNEYLDLNRLVEDTPTDEHPVEYKYTKDQYTKDQYAEDEQQASPTSPVDDQCSSKDVAAVEVQPVNRVMLIMRCEASSFLGESNVMPAMTLRHSQDNSSSLLIVLSDSCAFEEEANSLRSSMMALFELAETVLGCSRIIVALERSRTDLTDLIRAFAYAGFSSGEWLKRQEDEDDYVILTFDSSKV